MAEPNKPLDPSSPSPSSPLTDSAKKAVSFAPADLLTSTSDSVIIGSSPPSSSTNKSDAEGLSLGVGTPSSLDTPTRPSQPKRRRSSLKTGLKMPELPPAEHWKHADPLLRRLRLRDPLTKGKHTNLNSTFRDAKVVLFLFGSTWKGMSREPYDLVDRFARRNPHRCKVVYVSVDPSETAYDAQLQQKSWLAMEWNDGSNLSEGEDDSPTPSEPFLLAGDTDLEEELHHTDPQGSLYTRPYSRVFLAEKYQVLGVPSLMVYHLEKREVLTTHARFELLREEKIEETWAKWEKGEKINFSFGDLLGAMKYTVAFGVAGVAYLAAVHLGGAPDVVRQWSENLTRSYLSR